MSWGVRGLALLLLASLAGLGCEFKVPAPTYIYETKLIAVRAEVVELGPLNPGRVGVPSAAPIAEPMPYDRFSFEAVVIAPSGEQLPASELDSIWFQCGVYDCHVTDFTGTPMPAYDQRCDALEPYSMDDQCRLGEGDGRFEFVLPELGPLLAESPRVAKYYGVIAWNGRSAEDCWATRRSLDGLLDDCAFILRSVKVGPSWWMLAYADQVLGIETQIPVWQIPFAVYGQAANRTPSPLVLVSIDGEIVGSYPNTHTFSGARPGSIITLVPDYDEIEQFGQTYFVAKYDAEYEKYWFEPAPELLVELPFTTNAIHSTADIDSTEVFFKLEFVVDEYAPPARSTIFLVHTDDRFGEGVIRLDFDVEAAG